ncbi:SpoIIE family protein phosphatase [Spirochaetota bacterium]
MKDVNILIVEDEAIIATNIEDILKKLGYKSAGIAHTGKNALALVEKYDPQIILMDINLKGEMDGIEAAESIKHKYNKPVIFITAYSEEELLQRAKTIEPYGYLLKPINKRELHVIIEIALYRSEIDKKLQEYNLYLEGAFNSQTIELKNTIEKLNNEINERKIIEEALRKSEADLLNRNKKFELDMKNAQVLQRALLPTTIPEYNNLNIAYKYLPLDAIGGDFFSFTNLQEGGLGIFIGDVENHGISASLFISLVKFATNNACRLFGQKPSQYLEQLEKDLSGNMATSYITAIYSFLQYNEESNILNVTISSGGHPKPILQRSNSHSVSKIDISGPLIGYTMNIGFADFELELYKGDRIYFYTDGLTEVRKSGNELLESEDLKLLIEKASVKDLATTLDNIINEVKSFSKVDKFNDDVLIIGIEN